MGRGRSDQKYRRGAGGGLCNEKDKSRARDEGGGGEGQGRSTHDERKEGGGGCGPNQLPGACLASECGCVENPTYAAAVLPMALAVGWYAPALANELGGGGNGSRLIPPPPPPSPLSQLSSILTRFGGGKSRSRSTETGERVQRWLYPGGACSCGSIGGRTGGRSRGGRLRLFGRGGLSVGGGGAARSCEGPARPEGVAEGLAAEAAAFAARLRERAMGRTTLWSLSERARQGVVSVGNQSSAEGGGKERTVQAARVATQVPIGVLPPHWCTRRRAVKARRGRRRCGSLGGGARRRARLGSRLAELLRSRLGVKLLVQTAPSVPKQHQ